MQAITSVQPKYYLKANRIFTPIRRHAWILVPVLALGSLYVPWIGLGVALIMLTIAVTGLFDGRYFCGNLCPHSSLFDRFMLPISLNRKIPKVFTSPVTKWGFFGFYMLMFITRLGRIAPFWGDIVYLERLGEIMGRQYLTMPTVVGLTLAFLNPRTWCSFCPMGTFSEVMHKVGTGLGLNRKTDKKVTISSTSKCHMCATCARVCPMQLTPFQNFNENNQFDSDMCIRCGTCVAACPADVLSLQTEDGAVRLMQDTALDGYENRHRVTAKLEKISSLRDNVKELTFNTQNASEDGLAEQSQPAMGYQPGQFVLVKVSDSPYMYRAYSVSSMDPNDPQRLSVTVMNKPGGYGSHAVFNEFSEGQNIDIVGPMGNELVVDKSKEQIVMVAGGIGITPFVPIVKDIVDNPGNVKKATLLYGVNKEHEFLYDDYFTRLSEESSIFDYVKAVAFPETDWNGHTGFVTAVMEDMDLRGHELYMCGPPPMIKAVNTTLERMKDAGTGIDDTAIHYETAS